MGYRHAAVHPTTITTTRSSSGSGKGHLQRWGVSSSSLDQETFLPVPRLFASPFPPPPLFFLLSMTSRLCESVCLRDCFFLGGFLPKKKVEASVER